KEIWLKGLLAESGYELSLVAGIATGASPKSPTSLIKVSSALLQFLSQ
ncbi:hypothetical protein Tco_0518485, partial [Tanacetum coccineum]